MSSTFYICSTLPHHLIQYCVIFNRVKTAFDWTVDISRINNNPLFSNKKFLYVVSNEDLLKLWHHQMMGNFKFIVLWLMTRHVTILLAFDDRQLFLFCVVFWGRGGRTVVIRNIGVKTFPMLQLSVHTLIGGVGHKDSCNSKHWRQHISHVPALFTDIRFSSISLCEIILPTEYRYRATTCLHVIICCTSETP